MKLSISGRLFEKDYRYCEISLEDFIKLASEIGYQGIELRKTQISLETPAAKVVRVASLVEKAGLEVTCVTARGIFLHGEESFRLFQRYTQLAETLACKLIKITGDVHWIQRAADYAAERGITLAGNNHVKTPLETVSASLRHLQAINRDNYRLIYDPANLFMAQEDYGPATIRRLANYICYVTVQCPKRVPLNQDRGLFQYKGFAYDWGFFGESGVPDFTQVFHGLKEIAYAGWVSLIHPRVEQIDSRRLAALFYKRLNQMIQEG